MAEAPQDFPPMRLGYPRTALRRRLVAAVLAGEKTATSSLRAWYAPHTDVPLARAGERSILLGDEDEPLAVLETTAVRVLPLRDVDLAFARHEGEGFATVAEWRRAHAEFWEGAETDDETLVVAERFRVVERLGP